MVKLIPSSIALLTRVKPGSEIPGVPLSVIRATDFPSLKYDIIFFPDFSSLCS
jgi:hypothetical protein